MASKLVRGTLTPEEKEEERLREARRRQACLEEVNVTRRLTAPTRIIVHAPQPTQQPNRKMDEWVVRRGKVGLIGPGYMPCRWTCRGSVREAGRIF